MAETNILDWVFAVFAQVADWFVSAMSTVQGIFWTTEGLTFVGILTLAGLGISVIFLLLNVIKGFLRFR